MPGPMSAPNGQVSLTDKPRKDGHMVKSGKTAYKRGEIGHAGKDGKVRKAKKLSRAQREQQEES